MRVLPAGAEWGSVIEVGKTDPHPGAILASTVAAYKALYLCGFLEVRDGGAVQLGSRAGWQPRGYSKCLFS